MSQWMAVEENDIIQQWVYIFIAKPIICLETLLMLFCISKYVTKSIIIDYT